MVLFVIIKNTGDVTETEMFLIGKEQKPQLND